MLYISGARLLPDEQVRIASTKMDGIGPKKAIQLCYRLGISGNIKINELTKYQIDQIQKMISKDHVVHWELKRGERADIERLISISRYRGIRHKDRLPLRGQRTHTNARTAKLLVGKRSFSSSRQKQRFGAQLKTLKQVCGSFKQKLAQYREVAAFGFVASRFMLKILLLLWKLLLLFKVGLFLFFIMKFLFFNIGVTPLDWGLFEMLQSLGPDLGLVPGAPAPGPQLQLNGLHDAVHRLVLNREISLLIEDRVRGQLLENNVLPLAELVSIFHFGDPHHFVRNTAQFVLQDIDFHQEMDIGVLQELFQKLQRRPRMLDSLIKDALVPQPPLL